MTMIISNHGIVPPIGFVLMPSPWIDTCHEDWLKILNRNPFAITVNFAYFSRRLREADCLPGNHVALDNFRRLCRQIDKSFPGGVIKHAALEKVYREPEYVRTWGGYDFWFRNERVYQKREKTKEGKMGSGWVPLGEVGPGDDGSYIFAGLYTSLLACNLIAALITDFTKGGTVIVLGEERGGRYCRDVLNLPQRWHDMLNEFKSGHSGGRGAGDNRWTELKDDAWKRSGTRIYHLEGSLVQGIAKVSEKFMREYCMEMLEAGTLYPEVVNASN